MWYSQQANFAQEFDSAFKIYVDFSGVEKPKLKYWETN